ncbi:class I SAM-dependent methyltransferase [Chitinibacter sp. SCUT-21]|uniref:class I SAM-dependent methyltransferase n=1 Tax=Chitinibacter sp. SCUT-21 TaxID=2970891 RepID=UPI0035A74839
MHSEKKQHENQEAIWNTLAPSVAFSIEPDFYNLQRLVSKKSRVLDFGCGYGRVAKKLKDCGYKNIIGIDSSLEMIRRGITEYPELDLRHAKSSQSLVDHGKFDAIIFCAALTCMPESNIRKSSIEMAHSMLTDDGIIYCCEFARNSNTEYSNDGCFESGIGIKMKHFLVD